MGKEIERKFLMADETWRDAVAESVEMCQAYLSRRPEATVRVRIGGNRAWITVKGKNYGVERSEWEYEIPVAEAREMLDCPEMLQGNVLSKTRHIVDYCGFRWEIDEFHGSHSGLVVAEVEMQSATQQVPLPPFIGKEVTGNPAYYNSTLAQ